jgi:hypothetical protein
MLKKVTGEIKAAVVLIVTENVTALRNFAKSVTKSVLKSFSGHFGAIRRGKKRP